MNKNSVIFCLLSCITVTATHPMDGNTDFSSRLPHFLGIENAKTCRDKGFSEI